ncbi:MAG: hypothetical protein ACI8V2_003227 [Candidatus Latescibacterota bacterium]|jgi:hypothetical protein
MDTTMNPLGQLRAGVARVDITNREAGPVNDPLYVKALVLRDDVTTVVLVTVDAVAIAEIGTIRNDYLANVRVQLNRELNIEAASVVINASHCHGVVCKDVEARTVEAVKEAWENMVPVHIGVGTGHEDRIMENRRLRLKNGTEVDVRHAYALPADEDVEAVGPIDPEIGILRLDREGGQTLAVVFNFACHPIMGVPSRGNTADLSGFACDVIEDNLDERSIAFFLQGCAGDINPVLYKDVNNPRDGETLGNLLGLSTLKALKKIQSEDDGTLKIIREILEVPRADLAQPIEDLLIEQMRLLQSLNGTNLNLKTFLPLIVKYKLSDSFPSYSSHRYLHERMMGRNDLDKLDAENRQNMDRYIENIHTMEELTRVQVNLNLLKKRQAQNVAAGMETIEVEVMGLRIGDFVLVTFPGELSVQIGLNLKKKSPHKHTFVAGVTNGYIYYTPTAEQLKNRGGAQEDSDCLVAPEWQMLFENKVTEILTKL